MSDSAHFFFSSFLNFSALNEIPEIFEKTSPLIDSKQADNIITDLCEMRKQLKP